MEFYQTIPVFLAAFAIVAMAAKQVGNLFARLKLPKITGYLFTGLITGPFVLNLIPEEAVEHLLFIDEFSLAFIAFAAGSELYLPELKGRFKSIGWVTGGLVIFTFILGGSVVYLLADNIPFMSELRVTDRVAVAILAAAILVARSPASAIAIINEVRAKGPFTQIALGVTVIMDVIVIVIFAISSSVADALLTEVSFDASFVTLLLIELTLAGALGYLFSQILRVIIAVRLAEYLKIALVLFTGFAVFVLSTSIRSYSHEFLPFEVLVEPLLVCLVASFTLNNFSPHRKEFGQILHRVGPYVYIVFFTLTGDSLRLDVFLATWPIALALFTTRVVAVAIGSFTGGMIAGDPMQHNRLKWMGFITQAGVAVGLAKEVSVEFPEWGTAFATMIISVVVLNETVGPLFFKYALQKVGETRTRARSPEYEGERNAIIFGLDGPSLALARQLGLQGWYVKLATRGQNFIRPQNETADYFVQHIDGLDLQTMSQLEADKAEVIVAMLPKDEENLAVCALAYENFGTSTLVVRLNDPTHYERFQELGVLIVDPRTAMVSLLDHIIRSPSVAPLLLGADEDQDIVDVVVRDPTLHGRAIRDLPLPLDILIMSIHREGQTLVTHGHTRLQLGDEVTVVGSKKSLDELSLRFEVV